MFLDRSLVIHALEVNYLGLLSNFQPRKKISTACTFSKFVKKKFLLWHAYAAEG